VEDCADVSLITGKFLSPLSLLASLRDLFSRSNGRAAQSPMASELERSAAKPVASSRTSISSSRRDRLTGRWRRCGRFRRSRASCRGFWLWLPAVPYDGDWLYSSLRFAHTCFYPWFGHTVKLAILIEQHTRALMPIKR
jgi:hypothetical protein